MFTRNKTKSIDKIESDKSSKSLKPTNHRRLKKKILKKEKKLSKQEIKLRERFLFIERLKITTESFVNKIRELTSVELPSPEDKDYYMKGFDIICLYLKDNSILIRLNERDRCLISKLKNDFMNYLDKMKKILYLL